MGRPKYPIQNLKTTKERKGNNMDPSPISSIRPSWPVEVPTTALSGGGWKWDQNGWPLWVPFSEMDQLGSTGVFLSGQKPWEDDETKIEVVWKLGKRGFLCIVHSTVRQGTTQVMESKYERILCETSIIPTNVMNVEVRDLSLVAM